MLVLNQRMSTRITAKRRHLCKHRHSPPCQGVGSLWLRIATQAEFVSVSLGVKLTLLAPDTVDSAVGHEPPKERVQLARQYLPVACCLLLRGDGLLQRLGRVSYLV